MSAVASLMNGVKLSATVAAVMLVAMARVAWHRMTRSALVVASPMVTVRAPTLPVKAAVEFRTTTWAEAALEATRSLPFAPSAVW